MTLYVVATPIGNLSDMSSRAAEVFNSVDFILCEDTRTTSVLLNHFKIKKPLYSYHKFNEQSKTGSIIDRIVKENLNAALVTDAGTPCISDPGSVIVDAAYKAGIEVVGIPGASAVILALSISGYETDSYTFFGFLSRKSSDRKKIFNNIKLSDVEIYVLYESPHRIINTLKEMAEVFPASEVTVCNDLTKKFERIYRGNTGNVITELTDNVKSEKGEYVVVLKTNFERAKELSRNELYALNLKLKKQTKKSDSKEEKK